MPGFVSGVALLGQSINIFMPLSQSGWLKSGIKKIDNFALFNSESESKKHEFGCGFYVSGEF